MNEMLLHHADNTFSLPHMGKAGLERQGELPVNFAVDQAALETIYMNYELGSGEIDEVEHDENNNDWNHHDDDDNNSII